MASNRHTVYLTLKLDLNNQDVNAVADTTGVDIDHVRAVVVELVNRRKFYADNATKENYRLREELAEALTQLDAARGHADARGPEPAAVRAQAATAVKAALSTGLADSATANLDALAAAAVDAVAPTLEEATLQYVYAAATAEAGDHDHGCHGHLAASRIAYAIDHGCEPDEEGGRTRCSVSTPEPDHTDTAGEAAYCWHGRWRTTCPTCRHDLTKETR